MSTKHQAIDRLLGRGLNPRDLIIYMLPGIAWLAEHQDDTFRLCHYGDEGSVIVESVPAPALIPRAMQLGWRVDFDEQDPRNPQYMFADAVYHCYRGVHWYAIACDDSTEMLPLGFPTSALQAAKKRDQKKYGEEAMLRRKKRIERELQQEIKDRERRFNAELAAIAQLVADELMTEAQAEGKSITKTTARRKAWARIRRCNDGDYTLLRRKLQARSATGETP